MSDKFDDFQLEEYKNISNSHFEANKQIGIFFRYFLLIASAPALIFIWFGKEGSIIYELVNGTNTDINLFVGFFLLAISFIGIIFCFYIISFRLDSILYARTVNGIRKYFYNKEKPLFENQFRVLPKQTNQPAYRQRHTFTILIYAIALINSTYFGIGTRIIASVGNVFFNSYFPFKVPILIHFFDFFWALIFSIPIFFLHLGYYWFISNFRNYNYMRNLTIGIDIDGVLNRHRETFCTFLFDRTKKSLWAHEIIKVPVSLIPNKNIKREDEFLVFNNPNYWIQQIPINENVGKIINELRNTFGYKIKIFSYRAWPDLTYLPEDEHKNTLTTWWKYSFKPINFPFFLRNSWLYKNYFRFIAITSITKKWLKDNNIKYDNLLIEKGSIDIESYKFNLLNVSKINFNNRFYHSRKYSYRYFIEDVIENAIKLSANCEYVLLMNQPYNQIDPTLIPSNIIRVNSWSEIKEKIRELG